MIPQKPSKDRRRYADAAQRIDANTRAWADITWGAYPCGAAASFPLTLAGFRAIMGLPTQRSLLEAWGDRWRIFRNLSWPYARS